VWCCGFCVLHCPATSAWRRLVLATLDGLYLELFSKDFTDDALGRVFGRGVVPSPSFTVLRFRRGGPFMSYIFGSFLQFLGGVVASLPFTALLLGVAEAPFCYPFFISYLSLALFYGFQKTRSAVFGRGVVASPS